MTIFAAVFSSAIFLISLIFIFSQKMDRSIAALAGAVLMLGLGKILGFYSEEAALDAIDFNALGLLFGMMILVAMLEPTGFFQYVAVWAARASRGRPLPLFVLLGSTTTVLSMFLDNVTTVVLLAPVTILICEILGVSPLPYLMAEALLSDTGGVATLIGDLPNMLIGSAAGFSFNDFLVYSLPVVIVAWGVALVLLRFLFHNELSGLPANPEAVMRLDPAQSLDDPKTARRILIVLAAAMLLFFVHPALHIRPSFIATSAAAIALIWVRPDIHEMLQKVNWSVLLFVSALFVMVGGLKAAGVVEAIVGSMETLSGRPPLWFGISLIWIVAALSAVVDNVPITIALIPVLQGLAESGAEIRHLWWALAFGAGFGGNGTIMGSTANIIIVRLSEKTRTPINSSVWSRRGLPVMLATCVIASVLFLIISQLF
jgi:Na+/H+ antiporter NhaD/arsenite permease-like protein